MYIDMGFILPVYNVHPYFSLKNVGKKSVHYTWRNTVTHRLSYNSFIQIVQSDSV